MPQSRYISIRNMTFTLIIMMSVFPFGFMLYSFTTEQTFHVNSAIQESVIQNEQNAKLITQTVESSELLLNMLSRLPIVQAGNEQTVNGYLLDLVSRYPQYSSIFIVDKAGQRWATTNQISGAVSYSDRKYFVNAISSGNFSSGEYAIGKIKKKPVFSFGLPVKNNFGAITGVAVATIELSGLKSLMKKQDIADYRSVIVMDHAGKILLHTTHAEFEGMQAEETVFRRIQQGSNEATLEAERGQGSSRIIAYKKLYLPGESSPYMYVLLESGKDQLLKEANRLLGIKFSTLLATMFSSLILAYWFSKHFVLNKAEESEQRYQALFSRAGDGIFVMSTDGRLIEVNESFASMHGYSPEEMLQFGLKDLDTPETARLIPERMAKIFAEKSLTFEVEHYHKDGHIFPLEVSASMIFANGELYIQCFHRDITERKNAENSLKASKEMYLSLYHNTPVMLHSIDANGYLISVSDYWLSTLGYTQDEVIGRKSTEFLTEESRKYAIETVLPEFRKTGYCNNIEYQFVKKNGEVIDTLLSAISERDENGMVGRTLAVVTDITKRKNAEKALRESDDRFQNYIINAPHAIFVCDENGQYVDVNPAACSMTGYTLDELLSMSLPDLLPPESMEWLAVNFNRVAETGRTTGETAFRRKNNEIGYWSLSGVKLSPTRFIAFVNDITDRKREEEEHDRLEKQLLHAQKLESLGVLAGGIAHDFNNILTSIIGNADLALMRINPTSPAVENLHRIEQASARAADLAKQMLAYSGKGKFVVENINLNDLLEEMLHMLEVSISKKAILRFNQASTLPSVEADATQMRQIIMNLVINASEAIGEKSGVIAITTGCMDCDKSYLKDVWLDENISDGLYVYLEIVDTGCGMDKDTVAKLFDPFFTTKFTGRGLGMAAVLGIVRGHKGAIKVYSEVGKGTTFKILLPASNRPVEIFNGELHKDDWKCSGIVLLVDDEETVRGIGKEMLQELGFTIITANDGREAVDIFKTNSDIAFVILDLTMPHMDGEQCFRELKKISPDVKVIMSSGYNEHEVTQKFVGKGLAGFIQKPYKLSVLKDAIRKII